MCETTIDEVYLRNFPKDFDAKCQVQWSNLAIASAGIIVYSEGKCSEKQQAEKIGIHYQNMIKSFPTEYAEYFPPQFVADKTLEILLQNIS